MSLVALMETSGAVIIPWGSERYCIISENCRFTKELGGSLKSYFSDFSELLQKIFTMDSLTIKL